MRKRAMELALTPRWREDRGAILVIALVLLAALAALGAGVITLTSIDIRTSGNYRGGVQALYVAEAGVADAQARLSQGVVSDKGAKTAPKWNVGTLYSSKGFDNSFTIVHQVDKDAAGNSFVVAGQYVVSAVGKAGKALKQLEVVLGVDSPLAPKGAINIFGDVTKHAKVDIKSDKKRHGDEILVNGHDVGKENPSDGLALGIEDPEALKDITDRLAKHLKKSGDLENILQGDPVSTFTDKKGNDAFTASIGPVDSHGFDAALMEKVADQLAQDTRNLVATQTFDLQGKKDADNTAFPSPDANGVITLGGSSSDVVVIKNGKVDFKKMGGKDVTIQGTGTLVIDGGDVNLHDITLNWKGDIYILGDGSRRDDSKLHVHQASVKIEGDIYALGSRDGKASLRFHNDDKGKNDGSTTINGSVFGFSGTGKNSKVELQARHGDLEINGLVTLTGAKVKLDLDQDGKDGGAQGKGKANDDSDIRINGSIAVLLPDASYDNQENKVDIKLKAHGGGEGSLVVQYNSDIVKAAADRLLRKVDLPMPVKVLSWREVSAS